jgi:hypothetical protein
MHTSNPFANSADKPEAGRGHYPCKKLQNEEFAVFQKAYEVRNVQYALVATLLQLAGQLPVLPH